MNPTEPFEDYGGIVLIKKLFEVLGEKPVLVPLGPSLIIRRMVRG
jgi:hypothetical protein